MTYGSLCSGVGGLDLAVEEVFGFRQAWHCESDKDAARVMQRHFGTPNLGDITQVDWAEVEPVDLLCAGPPCQPVSVAGKRKGEDDERFLWEDVLRAVGGLRPRRLVFENPPGIAPWLPAILRRLADLGYVGRYGRLRASDVGCCHRRERLFVVAHDPSSRRDGEPTQHNADLARKHGDQAERGEGGGQHRGRGGGTAAHAERHPLRQQPVPEPRSGGAAERGRDREGPASKPHGQGRPSDQRVHGAGDGRGGHAPATDAPQFGCIRSGGSRGRRNGSADDRRFPWGRYRPAIERAERIFGPAPWPVIEGTRSLSGDFTAWMMMMPDGWLDGLSNTAKKRVSGNAVVTRQAVAALEAML